jgi:serine/threonine-protein kinase RsbW
MEHITLPGTLESLEAVRRYVARYGEVAGLDKRAIYRLRLAVDEVVTNIVTHGYTASSEPGPVEIWAEIAEGALAIFVEDTGTTYDPGSQAPNDSSQPLAERPAGGLGLFLAMENVDEFRYERIGERNRHTFIMHRP